MLSPIKSFKRPATRSHRGWARLPLGPPSRRRLQRNQAPPPVLPSPSLLHLAAAGGAAGSPAGLEEGGGEAFPRGGCAESRAGGEFPRPSRLLGAGRPAAAVALGHGSGAALAGSGACAAGARAGGWDGWRPAQDGGGGGFGEHGRRLGLLRVGGYGGGWCGTRGGGCGRRRGSGGGCGRAAGVCRSWP